MHISSLRLRTTIHLARTAYIALLLAEKVIVLVEYLDFPNAFLNESENMLSK